MNSEQRLAVLEGLLGRLLGAVSAADAKIPAIFATDTAMLGVLVALMPKFGSWKPCEATFAGMAGTFLLGSIPMLSFASFPRTKGPKASVLFFGSICKRPLAKYLDEIGNLTVPEYLEDLGSQCHRNAQIAAKKYFWIKRAMAAMYGGVLFWLPSVFLLYRRTS